MRSRTLTVSLGLLLLAGCGGSGQDRLPAAPAPPNSATNTPAGPGPSLESAASPSIPEPSRSRRLPSRETSPSAVASPTRSPSTGSAMGSKSAAEQGFDDALTALPTSEFQVTYDLANAPTDTLTVRWRPPQVAAEFTYLGLTYRVVGDTQAGGVSVCVKVAKRWACDEQAPTQAVDPAIVAAVLDAVSPQELAAAAEQLASLPGAEFSSQQLAGTKAYCVAQAGTTICLAKSGAPLLAEAVEQIALPGFSDIGLRATAYSTDAGL